MQFMKYSMQQRSIRTSKKVILSLAVKKTPTYQEITRKEKAKVKKKNKALAQIKTSLIKGRISLGF